MKILTMKMLEVTFPSAGSYLVVFLLLVIFQVLLVWMISTPSEDRDNWGGVFAPLFSQKLSTLCAHPGLVRRSRPSTWGTRRILLMRPT